MHIMCYDVLHVCRKVQLACVPGVAGKLPWLEPGAVLGCTHAAT